MKIAVLAGGYSPERDVSLTSGSLIANSLIKSGHEVALVDLYLGVPGLKKEDIPSLFYTKKDNKSFTHKVESTEPDLEALKRSVGGRKELIGEGVIDICSYADIAFLALHGGIGEDGRLQALLDIYGIKYTGSGYYASAAAMDKQITKKLISAEGIDTAKWIIFDYKNDSTDRVKEELGYPCVVKPCGCGSSVGVSIVEDESELKDALALAGDWERYILIEQKIVGREFSVAVLDGKVLPPIEIIPLHGFYDYKNKYQAGCTKEVCPADITEAQDKALRDGAKRVFDALSLKAYSRIDFILTEEGKAYCLEANNLPGMTPNSLLPQEAAAEGISYDALCEKIASLAID